MTFNSLIIQVPLNLMLVVLIPLALIKLFSNFDSDIGETLRLRKRDVIIIIIASLLYIITSTLLLSNDINMWINTSLITGYLIFCSYTDLKTKLLYTIISVALLIIEGIWLVIDIENIVFNEYTWTILIVLLILYLMSIPKFLGLGDALIYSVITTYLVHYRIIPTMSLIINLLLANVLFLVITVILKVIKKDKERHQPFTLFIAISTCICSLLLV